MAQRDCRPVISQVENKNEYLNAIVQCPFQTACHL